MRTPMTDPEPDPPRDDATTQRDELLAAFARATRSTDPRSNGANTSHVENLDDAERAKLAAKTALRLSNVKPVRLPKPTVEARNRRLTPELAATILLAVGNGSHRQTAARYAGIWPETLSRWMKREGEPYETFARLVRKREAAFELNQLTHITSASSARPELALALLERKFPQRWGKALGQGAGVAPTFNLAVILERAHARPVSSAPVIDAEPVDPDDDA